MTASIPWDDIRVLTFDCYGTLIDWETGILAVLRPWARGNSLAATDEDLLAAYRTAEAAVQQETPTALYRNILRATMNRIAGAWKVASSARDGEALASSIGSWPAFPDTADALADLQRRFKLVVVSNVDHASFMRTAPKLRVKLDGLITAEDVGAYKPDPRMLQAALRLVGEWSVTSQQVMHVAESVYHDITPAKHMGLFAVWVDRQRRCEGGRTATVVPDPAPDLHVHSLSELAAIAGSA
jgi:2-haloacid dehalogenase